MNREALAAFVAQVGEFHLRGRRIKAAQAAMTERIARGEISDAEARAYLREVHRYFEAFEREARRHLADLEKRLAHTSQVQFNLTAERGVAARRVEVTQGVLSKLAELAAR